MLYPTNIKTEKKEKILIIKEKIKFFKSDIKGKIKYLILDRSNLCKKILAKLHI